MKFTKKIISLLIIIIFSILLSLLVIEGSFRVLAIPKINFSSSTFSGSLYQSWKSDQLFVPSVDRIIRMAPNVGTDNYWRSESHGFRFNPDNITESVPLQTQKILMIGDSFTYGHGVKHDETYPAKFGNTLSTFGINARVDNAGVPGYGPDQEFVYVTELLRFRQYDVIVWNISLNDLWDTNAACLFRKTPFGFIRFPGWMNTHYILMSYARSTNPIIVESYVVNYFLAGMRGFVGKDRFTYGCSKISPTGDDQFYDFTEKIILFNESLKRYFQKYALSTKLVYVLTPFRGDFNMRSNAQGNAAFNNAEEKIDRFMNDKGYAYFNASNRMVSLGVSSVDSSADFFLEEKEFGDYSHLNAAGNAVFAKLVAEWIAPILR